MIEVIKKGPEKFIVTCMRCGTKFSYQLDDIWNNLITPYVKCPVCKQNCYHSIYKNEEDNTQQKIDYVNNIEFNG